MEEEVLGIRYALLDDLIPRCDVISIHCPLTPETDGLFNRERLFNMKKGAYLVNTARGRIVNTQALVEAMESQHLAGYAGDVWYPQPAPADHPWRHMPNQAMTPHVSGTSLEAQKRYADGIKDCLERFLDNRPIEKDYLIVDGGKVVSPSLLVCFQVVMKGVRQILIRTGVMSPAESLGVVDYDSLGSLPVGNTIRPPSPIFIGKVPSLCEVPLIFLTSTPLTLKPPTRE